MTYEEYFRHLQELYKMKDVVIGTLGRRERPLAFEHGPLFAQMMKRAAKCLGLVIVEERMAHGPVEVAGKKREAFRFSFSLVKQ